MNIAIIGTGAVGGYFGGKLAQSGANVTFVARGEHFKAIKQNGLQVKSIHGDFVVTPVNVVENIAELKNPDLILVCVKAWQVKDAAKQLKSIITKNSIIIPLQNGVLAADEISEEIGGNYVLGGLCRILSKIQAPGIIEHSGVEPAILFGELNNEKTERVLRIQKIFEKAGFYSRIAEDIHSELWKKFISICVSGLLAITRSTYGQVREITETRKLMIDLLNEGYQVSQKAGIKINEDFVTKTEAFIDTFPYNSTSSLTRDIIDGKPSEIEYQNGTIVKLGVKFGIETPVNQFIYSCILPMEARARKK